MASGMEDETQATGPTDEAATPGAPEAWDTLRVKTPFLCSAAAMGAHPQMRVPLKAQQSQQWALPVVVVASLTSKGRLVARLCASSFRKIHWQHTPLIKAAMVLLQMRVPLREQRRTVV